MGKRFTDTEKWKKPFLRGLEAPYKLLWLYICDDCDHAGIWQVDLEVAEIRIGEKLCKKKAIEVLGDKFISIDNDTKWFIPSFINFQYPSGLNPNNNAHVNIIKTIEKNKYEIEKVEPLTSPSTSPSFRGLGIGLGIGTGLGIGLGIGIGKEKDVKIKKTDHLFSESPFFDLETFKAQFTGTQYAGANFEYYHEVINNWSVSNGNKKKDWIATAKNWMAADMTKGKFIDKNFKPNATAKTYQARTSHISSEQLHESLIKRFGHG